MKKLIAVIISILLLSTGWLSLSGLPLLVAMIPLLWLSDCAEDSKRGWWSTFWWALLCFVGWNITTVWWIWNATPVGPIAATVVSSTLSMIAFMCYHSASKKTTKALSYTLLVSLWIALEYIYTIGDISWPWLLFGNGFSNDIWAIQWYEYTGLFGGSLWVWICNIAGYEAFKCRTRKGYALFGAAVLVPLAISLLIYTTYEEPAQGTIKVAAVQPNFHYSSDTIESDDEQEQILIDMAAQAPEDVSYILMPECATPSYVFMSSLDRNLYLQRLRSTIKGDAAIITGASTVRYYAKNEQHSETARERNGSWYDIYNSAIYVPKHGDIDYHHKAKLVLGTESTPLPWLFKALSFLVIDLGGTTGQLGVGAERRVFTSEDGITIGTAICYEALYGAYYGEFVRNGARAMFVISNDCWWADTPGYKHLFAMSRLRAVEHRRAIARCANTGISGFITPRGDVVSETSWDERTVIDGEVVLNGDLTIYTQLGDYIAKLCCLMAMLTLLNYLALKYKRKNHLD